jgi:hypothetical protein
MATWLTRTAIATAILIGITMMGGLPASATPQTGRGIETVITYYNNASHSLIVGEDAFGCTSTLWGTISLYKTIVNYAC